MKDMGKSVFLVLLLGFSVLQAQTTVEEETVRQNLAHVISRVVELEREKAVLLERYEEQQALVSGRAMREQLPVEPDALLAWSYNDAGLFLTQDGQIDAAVSLFDAALAILSDVYSGRHPARGAVLQNMAEALWLQRDANAFARFAEAEKIFAGLGEEGYARLGALLNSWAVALAEAGEIADAEVLYRRAIAKYGRADDIDVVAPMHNLGVMFMQQGRMDDSRRLLEDAREKLAGSGRAHSLQMVAVLRALTRHARLQDRSWEVRQYEQQAQQILDSM